VVALSDESDDEYTGMYVAFLGGLLAYFLTARDRQRTRRARPG
jgi:hypothetical protein